MMKPDSLRALLIDQQLGELSPEASELLDAYLAHNPEVETEAAKIRSVLGITEQTVNERPELFREEGVKRPTFPFPIFSGLLRGGAAAILILLVGISGYYLGRTESPETSRPASLLASAENTPWAQYRLGEDSRVALITRSSNQEFTDKK